MFSIMTIASSTTKPTDTTIAMSERLSMVKPATHMSANVPASDSGTVTPAASVGPPRRRKANTTSVTSRIDTNSVRRSSAIEARMVWVRSDRMWNATPAGARAITSGSSALIASTVSTTLASACFVTWTTMAGLPSYEPATRVLRTLRSTSATSRSRTEAPLRTRTMTFSKSCGVLSCPLVPIVTKRSAPSNAPSGDRGLALMMA